MHDRPAQDFVSVIVPTLRRPALVVRAVASVLAQTHAALELIVIVDGPDDPTRAALAGIADPRLHVMANGVSEGPGPARNRAAAAARGPWVAFLDDDDEWLPEKLARQLAGRSPADPVVVSCRSRIETPGAVYVWPRRLCGAREPVDTYLFGRRSPMRGEAYLQPSSFLMPRDLFLRTGFDALRFNEDTALLLRATKIHGAGIAMLPDTLVVVHTEEARESLGSTFSWQGALAWLDGMGDLITRRAYSGFCLVTLSSQAAAQGDWRAVPVLLRAAWRRGSPSPVQIGLFAAFWVFPAGARRRLRAFLARRRPVPPFPPHPTGTGPC